MATERIGEVGLTVEQRLTYDRDLLMRAIPVFVHNRYARKASIPRRGGKTISFRRLEQVTVSATAFTEGSNPAEIQITFTEVQATLQQYGQWTAISEVAFSQSIDEIAREVPPMFADDMADTLDRLTRDVQVGGSTVQFNGTKGSRGGIGSGDVIDAAEIREAVSTLATANATPFEDGKYIAIIHPHTTRDLLGDSTIVTTFENAQVRGGANPLIQGVMGDYMRVRFVETSNAAIQTSFGLSGADVYLTMIMGVEYVGVVDYEASEASPMSIIVHPPGSSGTFDPLNTRGTIGWKAAHAASRLNNAFAVRLEHSATSGNQGT